MRKSNAVLVFLKYPQEGRVKTRLASTTSNKFAVEFYRIISDYLFEELEKVKTEADIFIYYTSDSDEKKIMDWVGRNYYFSEQEGSDLGTKMSNAFKDVFRIGYKKSVIVGSDIPELKSDDIKNVLSHLTNNDVVISPSDDGGYSILGMNNHYPDLFTNIQWSTSSVFAVTQERIMMSGLKLKILNSLNDVDTEEELKQWINTSENTKLISLIKNLAKKENIRL